MKNKIQKLESAFGLTFIQTGFPLCNLIEATNEATISFIMTTCNFKNQNIFSILHY